MAMAVRQKGEVRPALEVRRARHAGACYGVERALKTVQRAVSEREAGVAVHTLGPLIHNPQVVEDLAQKGVSSVDSAAEAVSGILVLRSHGVPPQVTAEAEASGLTVLDATCPHVMRAQKVAQELCAKGYLVVVVGERGHPEVEGISAYAGTNALVVQEPGDLPTELPQAQVGVVVQTTQSREALENIVNALKERGVDPEIHNTICFATRQRQEAAHELAAEVDVMLVVGGRNSGNTTRLAELCTAVCAHTYHIERPNELSVDWFKEAQSVGITAGASTPEEQIVAVEQHLAMLLGEQPLTDSQLSGSGLQPAEQHEDSERQPAEQSEGSSEPQTDQRTLSLG